MATKAKTEIVEEVKPKTKKAKKVKIEEPKVEAPKSWLEIAREKANAKYNK
jgi:hypothetical protein